MSAPGNGGPAFPTAGFTAPNGHCFYPTDGASLLDYMAVHAQVPVEADGCIPEALALAVMGDPAPDWFADRGAALAWWFTAEARVRYMKAQAMLNVRATLP